MSLIQEALKRQQQEMGTMPEDKTIPPTPEMASPTEATPITQPEISPAPGSNAEETNKPAPPLHKKPMTLASKTPPPPPAHAIEPKNLDTEKSTGSPWKKLIIFIIFLFLVIAAAAGMIIFALKNMPKKQPEQVATNNQITETTTITPKEKTNSFLAKIIKKKPEQTAPPEQTTVSTPNNNTDTATTPPLAPSVKWPHLKLMGALAKGGAGQAIINGKFITVGEEIEGVKLIKIKGNTVELSYKNETQLLKVGGSIQ
jgi:hypothetical protein